MGVYYFDNRSQGSGGLYPTIRREEPGGGDSDDERGSGEYFSGEEFYEDDIMLTKDRYCGSKSNYQPNRLMTKQCDNSLITEIQLWPHVALLIAFIYSLSLRLVYSE